VKYLTLFNALKAQKLISFTQLRTLKSEIHRLYCIKPIYNLSFVIKTMDPLNIPQTDLPRVVIVGGGFGGLKLIRKLGKTKRFQTVLIDKRNYHTFQPLLYQVSTAGLEVDSIAYPLRKTIKKRTTKAFFRLGEVKRVDPVNQLIHLDIGHLNYDYLVIATGSKTNFFGNKEIEEHAMRMKTVPQAVNIRSLILENLEQATITQAKAKRKALLNYVIA